LILPKHIKILLVFALIVLALMITKNIKEYHDNEKLKDMIFKEEVKTLNSFIVAFRKVYQKEFIEQRIAIDEKTIHLLPVYTMIEISQTFSHLMDEKTIVRTVSDNPRNPKNMANSKELEIIKRFKQTKSSEPFFERKGSKIFQVTPLYIEQSCLKCHGEKQSAPQSVQDTYDTAYGYKLGDLRGIISIEISKEAIVQSLDNNYKRQIMIAILVYLTFMTAVYFLIKIIRDNESKYSSQLQDANNTLETKILKALEENKKQHVMLEQQSRLAAIGEMIGNIAHQWRQPLSIITTVISGLQVKQEVGIPITSEMIVDTTDTIINQANYLSKTIDDFRSFIKNDATQEIFYLSKVIGDTISLVTPALQSNHIKLSLILDDTITYNGYPSQLSQVLINILNNAKDAFKEKNQEDKQIKIKTFQDETSIKIEIIDNAGGIPQEIKSKIFDPYFTTKHQYVGTGLGLYISVNIIQKDFDGAISIEDIEERIGENLYKGTKFIIEFEANQTNHQLDISDNIQ
jgi:signal transduction histidine kinase